MDIHKIRIVYNFQLRHLLMNVLVNALETETHDF